jgi:hypothetical protein
VPPLLVLVLVLVLVLILEFDEHRYASPLLH